MRGQFQRGQLQPVQLPGLDAPSSGKTSVLQPWREYGYSLQWENHTYSLLWENHSIEVFPQEGCNYL